MPKMIQSHRDGSPRSRPLSPVLSGILASPWVWALVLVPAVVVGLGTAVENRAWADDDDAAIEAVTKLNKKALEEYDNLSFDVARRTLDEALALCSKSGLDDHPIAARTHVHIGVVLLAAGEVNHAEAVKEFQKALTIQPDIKLQSRIANPEVQAAFDEAKTAIAATGPAKSQPKIPPRSAAAASAVASEPAASTPGLSHDAVASSAQGVAIPISVTTEPSLAVKKVALWFRPSGATKFQSIDLREYSQGNWSGSIPDGATTGDDVAYYVSAENEAGEVVGKAGSATAPIVTRLRAAAVAQSKKTEPEEPEEAKPTPPPEEHTWFLALAAGSGFGWASGNGDINELDKVNSGFASSKLGQILPEIGYFASPDMIISLQLRLQLVSGATPERDPTLKMCGSTHVCQPASGALAAFARLTWLFGEGVVVPFVSLAGGAGQIRHLATFPKAENCGADPNKPVQCVDTVTSGPIFVGGGAGLIFHATNNFGFTLGLNSLVGFPQFTFHFDFNAGVVVEL